MSIEPQADSNSEQASMPSLDDQLYALLMNPKELSADERIAQIKQAFQEFMPTWAEVIEQSQGVRMTGQEWYDRYKANLAGVQVITKTEWEAKRVNYTLELCDTAAKRAAGIGEGELL